MKDLIFTDGKGMTGFQGERATAVYAAITLRAAIKLMRAGIKPARGITMRKLLDRAGRTVGKQYRQGEHEIARADLAAWIEEQKAGIPVVQV